MIFNVIIGAFAFFGIFVFPIVSAIKDAKKEDNQEFEIESRYNNSIRKKHTHLRNTILCIIAAVAFISGILSIGVIESKKQHDDDVRFHQAISNSDCFSHIEYDIENKDLYLTFRDGGSTYLYANIPPELYQELYYSNNLGKFYNTRIKGQYPSMRID